MAMPTVTQSFNVLKIYGVPKSAAIFMATSIWYINKKDQDLFNEYYLLHWEPEYFRRALKQGTVTRHGIDYQVIYHRTNSYEVIKHTGDLILSFRQLQPEYNMFPVVLVSLDRPTT